MLAKYRGEHDGQSPEFPGQRVRYLSDEERQQRLVSVGDDGRLYQNGRPFDTGDTEGIYAMDRDGNVYATTEQERGEFHHSSLLAGDDAAAAGEIQAVDGHVTEINGESGHYQPGDVHTDQAVSELRGRGANIPDSSVK